MSYALLVPVILVLYLLVLLFLGVLGFLRSKQSEEDYYLAGRQQGWFITGLTIIATFFSSFAFLGAPGLVYRQGVVFALFALSTGWGVVAYILLAILMPEVKVVGKANAFDDEEIIIKDAS